MHVHRLQKHLFPLHAVLWWCNLPAVMRGSADSAHVAEWRGLADRYARCNSALERALGEEHELGVSEFEVLERLASADDDRRRVQELAADVHLSQSALSRVVARLERRGLVLRCMCPDDRRGIFVDVTDEGRSRYAAARPTHRRVLAEVLGDG
jgi:DNA-binding MarR family transcriptional regulator